MGVARAIEDTKTGTNELSEKNDKPVQAVTISKSSCDKLDDVITGTSDKVLDSI
jgi:hypothetical protein